MITMRETKKKLIIAAGRILACGLLIIILQSNLSAVEIAMKAKPVVSKYPVDSETKNGVQYFFDCTKGGGHDSVWIDEPIYVDRNLAYDTEYAYRFKVRDRITSEERGWSIEAVTRTPKDPAPPLPDDGDAPWPNPAQWARGWEPKKTLSGSIYSAVMKAYPATDKNGVEYRFVCTDNSGFSSGWQTSCDYSTQLGINPGIVVNFCVQARDAVTNERMTGQLIPLTALTTSQPDNVKPTPNPMQWAQNGQPKLNVGVDKDTVSMTAVQATDDRGVVLYKFVCSNDDSKSSQWQDGNTYSVDVPKNMTHTFYVIAKDLVYENQAGQSPSVMVGTVPPDPGDTRPPDPNPMKWSTSEVPAVVEYTTGGTFDYWNAMSAWVASDNSGGAIQYNFVCKSNGVLSSGWRTESKYAVKVGRSNQGFVWTVKARDASNNVTGEAPLTQPVKTWKPSWVETGTYIRIP